jgi:hypothetical protein
MSSIFSLLSTDEFAPIYKINNDPIEISKCTIIPNFLQLPNQVSDVEQFVVSNRKQKPIKKEKPRITPTLQYYFGRRLSLVPKDIAFHIASYLQGFDLARLSCVNKSFNQLCQSTELWMEACDRRCYRCTYTSYSSFC